MSTAPTSKKNHEKNEKVLYRLLEEEPNKFCADCGQRGTRWASWNLGIFLCIKCGGLHRKLGTHVSKVKSVTLDTWTDEQIESIKEKGNEKMNALYNPKKRPPPVYSGEMEQFIRDKYERKLFMDAASRLMMKTGGSTQAAAASAGASIASSLSTFNPSPLSTAYSSFGSKPSSTLVAKSPSEYLPKYIHSYEESKFGHALRQLYEMGFSMPDSNLTALKASQGDLSQAIEYLIASGKMGTFQRSKEILSELLPNRDDAHAKPSDLAKLKEMGFKDDILNREALSLSKGKFEEAINYIVQQSASRSPPNGQLHASPSDNQQASAAKKASLFDFREDEPQPALTTLSSPTAADQPKELAELLDHVHLPSATLPQSSEKDSILSLYGAQSFRPASGLPAAASAAALSKSFVRNAQLAPHQIPVSQHAPFPATAASSSSHARPQIFMHSSSPSPMLALSQIGAPCTNTAAALKPAAASDPFASLAPFVSFRPTKSSSESANATNEKKESPLDLSMFDSLN